MIKKLFAWISCILAILLSGIFLVGWLSPIGNMTPIWIMMSKSEFKGKTKNLLLGNWWVNFHTPKTLSIVIPAWNTDDFVYGMNTLSNQAKSGKEIYYDLYSKDECREDPKKKQVGLYCLNPSTGEKKPYVILLAGGGFSSVCTPMESLPVSASFCEMGYTCFALTYRTTKTFLEYQDPNIITQDIAKAISFIEQNADKWNIETEKYLIGGFSAGACAISTWLDDSIGYGKYNLKKPGVACLIYGIDPEFAIKSDIPSYILTCKNDEYFDKSLFDDYVETLSKKNINFSLQEVDCLHGFGLGTGTNAEGWTKDAEAFWMSEISK